MRAHGDFDLWHAMTSAADKRPSCITVNQLWERTCTNVCSITDSSDALSRVATVSTGKNGQSTRSACLQSYRAGPIAVVVRLTLTASKSRRGRKISERRETLVKTKTKPSARERLSGDGRGG